MSFLWKLWKKEEPQFVFEEGPDFDDEDQGQSGFLMEEGPDFGDQEQPEVFQDWPDFDKEPAIVLPTIYVRASSSFFNNNSSSAFNSAEDFEYSRPPKAHCESLETGHSQPGESCGEHRGLMKQPEESDLQMERSNESETERDETDPEDEIVSVPLAVEIFRHGCHCACKNKDQETLASLPGVPEMKLIETMQQSTTESPEESQVTPSAANQTEDEGSQSTTLSSSQSTKTNENDVENDFVARSPSNTHVATQFPPASNSEGINDSDTNTTPTKQTETTGSETQASVNLSSPPPSSSNRKRTKGKKKKSDAAAGTRSSDRLKQKKKSLEEVFKE